jgi:hypothetical protein
MEWVPESAWLTQVRVDGTADQIGFDLAIDASGARKPSRVAAGLELPGDLAPADRSIDTLRILLAVTFIVVGVGGVLLLMVSRPPIRTA